jgi:hypothetical protein
MYLNEFEEMIENLRNFEAEIDSVATKLTFENKILLVFLWIVKYVDYSVLSFLFGTTKSVVSMLIDCLLPRLASHFISYISNEVQSNTTSSLSTNIVAVIDSTIHATRKPSLNQHLSYSDHYKRHGMMTTLLVDFDGYIICLNTGGKARMHDSMSSVFMHNFRRILGRRYALGDPGYAGVDYVVSGFKTNQLINEERRVFDRISRTEQVVIEHVNNFIKTCHSLSKSNQFHHSTEKHVAIVFVVSGWYNWMKETYGKFS